MAKTSTDNTSANLNIRDGTDTPTQLRATQQARPGFATAARHHVTKATLNETNYSANSKTNSEIRSPEPRLFAATPSGILQPAVPGGNSSQVSRPSPLPRFPFRHVSQLTPVQQHHITQNAPPNSQTPRAPFTPPRHHHVPPALPPPPPAPPQPLIHPSYYPPHQPPPPGLYLRYPNRSLPVQGSNHVHQGELVPPRVQSLATAASPAISQANEPPQVLQAQANLSYGHSHQPYGLSQPRSYAQQALPRASSAPYRQQPQIQPHLQPPLPTHGQTPQYHFVRQSEPSPEGAFRDPEPGEIYPQNPPPNLVRGPLYLPDPPAPPPRPLSPPQNEEYVTSPGGTVRIKQLRPSRRRLNRDERRDILLMRRLGYSYETISRFLGLTQSSVSYTVQRGYAEPLHHLAGRRTRLPQEVVAHMVSYVSTYLEREKRAGRDHRTGRRNMKQLTYAMIKEECLDGKVDVKVTEDTIKKILNEHGVTMRPAISEAKRKKASLREKRKWLLREAERQRREAAGGRPEVLIQGNPDAPRPEELRDVVIGYISSGMTNWTGPMPFGGSNIEKRDGAPQYSTVQPRFAQRGAQNSSNSYQPIEIEDDEERVSGIDRHYNNDEHGDEYEDGDDSDPGDQGEKYSEQEDGQQDSDEDGSYEADEMDVDQRVHQHLRPLA